jgi:hypothetical protein
VSRNDGRKLEQLVARIEKHFLPRGFDVVTNATAYDEGAQLAEFDIFITGEVGTIPITCLIECRDRPSGGPAPAQWIETLAGRRNIHGFAKVMAVSSTGFSKGAIKTADRAGIELRRLESLSFENVAHWLPPTAPLILREERFGAVRLIIDKKSFAAYAAKRPVSVDAKILVGKMTKEKLSLRDLWARIVNQESLWRGIAEGGPPKEVTINALEHSQEEYDLSIEEEFIHLEAIEYDATLRVVIPQMPIVGAAKYSSIGSNTDSRETFVGSWVSSDKDSIREVTVISCLKRKGPSEETS